MKVPGLEMEPFGTETNMISEMLQCFSEFILSNHFVPKMLTLQKPYSYIR